TNRQIFRFLFRDPSRTGVSMIAKLSRFLMALAVLSLAAAPVEAQTKKPAARPAPKAAPAKPAAPPAAEFDANGMPVIQTAAKFAYLVDADSGQVLLNKNG